MVWTMLLVNVMLLLALASAEQYSFDNAKSPVLAQQGVPLLTRMLTDPTQDKCNYEGPYLVCKDGFEVGNEKNLTIVTFEVRCDIDTTNAFDFRKAPGCMCQAVVSNPLSEGGPKTCPCTICQAGFGDTPINVDCSSIGGSNAGENEETSEMATNETMVNETMVASNETMSESNETMTDGVSDSVALPSASHARHLQNGTTLDPYIFDTCTSVDCSGACNGTCALNCDASGVACSFCANAPGNQATLAPTQAKGGPVKNFSAAGPGTYNCGFQVALLAVLTLVTAMMV
jgi:hypothetical protein